MKQEMLSATFDSLTTVAYHLSIVRLSRRFALSLRYADTGRTADAIQHRDLHGDRNCSHPLSVPSTVTFIKTHAVTA